MLVDDTCLGSIEESALAERLESEAYSTVTLDDTERRRSLVSGYSRSSRISARTAWLRSTPNSWISATLSLVGKSLPIDLVLADRGFESLQVYQTLNNFDVTYLFPKVERALETA
ncbi:hypothetical protein [Halocatena salina]|uniref:Uncharacterized protein n=1 Tax=Halocatena salina TaxID=2934340 RepID=A0A8U0A923_9EURY|nr:hypothetical protein [Halocatena salina]UPM44513.1 hypothetical protein MW046_13855 [Halocatena salina]